MTRPRNLRSQLKLLIIDELGFVPLSKTGALRGVQQACPGEPGRAGGPGDRGPVRGD